MSELEYIRSKLLIVYKDKRLSPPASNMTREYTFPLDANLANLAVLLAFIDQIQAMVQRKVEELTEVIFEYLSAGNFAAARTAVDNLENWTNGMPVIDTAVTHLSVVLGKEPE